MMKRLRISTECPCVIPIKRATPLSPVWPTLSVHQEGPGKGNPNRQVDLGHETRIIELGTKKRYCSTRTSPRRMHPVHEDILRSELTRPARQPAQTTSGEAAEEVQEKLAINHILALPFIHSHNSVMELYLSHSIIS
jgi:hypothetical protein